MKDGPSPVAGFQRQPSMVDYRGRLAAVYFIAGCNLRCRFCHNVRLLEPRPGYDWRRLREASRAFRDNWVDAAVVTGGEPSLHPDLPALLSFLRSLGWAVKIDTNGVRPDCLQRLLPLVDYVAMDVKCSLERYRDLTGLADPSGIAESIALLRASGVPHELRTTVIGSFHTDEEMLRIGDLIRGAPCYVLQPFVPRDDLADPALRTEPRTPSTRLDALRSLLAGCADTLL